MGELIRTASEITNDALLWVFLGLEFLALASVPSVLLRRRGRPTAALAWLLTLFALPAVGGICWWAFGRTRFERKKRQRVRKKEAFARTRSGPELRRHTAFDPLITDRAVGEYTFPTGSNHIELLLDGKNAFPKMEEALRQAKHSIHALYYIWQEDETGRRFRDLLVERAHAGVQVRVLVDGFGSRKFAGKFSQPLRDAGAKIGVFLQSRFASFRKQRLNFVNHRKILIVDGAVAFTGGMNVGDEYARKWRDAMVRLEGPAVAALDHVFLDDWYFATNELLDDPEHPPTPPTPDGVDAAIIASGPDTEAWIHDAYFVALTRAEERAWMATPYFLPGPAILAALRTAAGRGVDCRIVLPSASDVRIVKWAARSYYRTLVEAGVRIFEYQGPMLHAKALLTDRTVVSIGTSNVDSRSFRLSFEVSCFAAAPALNAQLAEWHEGLVRDSREVTSETLSREPTLQKLGESAAHLLSPLL